MILMNKHNIHVYDNTRELPLSIPQIFAFLGYSEEFPGDSKNEVIIQGKRAIGVRVTEVFPY